MQASNRILMNFCNILKKFSHTSNIFITNNWWTFYKLLINIYKILTNFLQTFHDLNFILVTNFLQTSYKILTIIKWTSCELFTNVIFWWTSYELPTNFLWTSYELLMNFLWTSYELLINFFWSSFRSSFDRKCFVRFLKING